MNFIDCISEMGIIYPVYEPPKCIIYHNYFKTSSSTFCTQAENLCERDFPSTSQVLIIGIATVTYISVLKEFNILVFIELQLYELLTKGRTELIV